MPSRASTQTAASENVFDRLLSLSHDALDALEAGDMERLNGIMQQRAATIAAEAPTGGAVADRLASALRLREADTRLQLALTAGRDEVEHHLEAMESGEVARSAYGPRNRSKGQLDVVR